MTHEKKYQEHMYLYEADYKLRGWGMHPVCSMTGRKEVSLGYSYKWFGTKGRVELKGERGQPSMAEIQEQLDKLCRVVENRLEIKTTA